MRRLILPMSWDYNFVKQVYIVSLVAALCALHSIPRGLFIIDCKKYISVCKLVAGLNFLRFKFLEPVAAADSVKNGKCDKRG